jgi:hypothetical protein
VKTNNPEYLERTFRHFAGMCDGQSPLYNALSLAIAEDPHVRSLVSETPDGQPPVNLLFGAVHYLLLGGEEHPLAEYYPAVGGRRAPDENAYAAFADFCRRFRGAIVELVATRRVQTSVPGRCGLLLPAFALAADGAGGRPLYLVDVGASLGLNLMFDRYRYDYGNGRTCGPQSPALIRTEVRGDVPFPAPTRVPRVAGRVGVDITPGDLDDAASIRWVESMIWADQMDRIRLFREAVEITRSVRPTVVRGDALDLLPGILEGIPGDAFPCVYHSHSIYQVPKEERPRLDAALADCSRRRELAHVSLEWLGDDPGPRLHLTHLARGEGRRRHLADGDHHGRWIAWVDGGG